MFLKFSDMANPKCKHKYLKSEHCFLWVCDICFNLVIRPSADDCPSHEYQYLSDSGDVWRCQKCHRLAGGPDWGVN